MTFGELTDQEKLSLEQRTSAFFNLAGISAQEALDCADSGLSLRRIYKILANSIQDWNWLSHKNPGKFEFHGIGGLIWIPHRFGALGLVRPHIDYTLPFTYGLFPNLIDLVGVDEYAKYGCSVKEENGERRIMFARYLPYEVLQKLPIEPHEQHFWRKIVSVYAPLDDDTLDAMASCRTRATSAHSLWIQFVHWKREMGTALDSLRQSDPILMDEEKRREVAGHIDGAIACMRNISIKMGFRRNLANFVEKVKAEASATELGDFLPCLDQLDPPRSTNVDFDHFVSLYDHLAAMNDICHECVKQMEIEGGGRTADLSVVEQRLAQLKQLGRIRPNLLDSRRWFSLLRPPKEKNKEIARLCLELITELFKAFERHLGLPILRPTEHYSEFLENHYPLPTDHFSPGF